MALSKAGISSILEESLPADHFLAPLQVKQDEDGQLIPVPNQAERTKLKEYLTACGLLRIHPTLGVAIDSNRVHIVEARRAGLSAIGLSGFSLHAQFLRSANEVVPSLEKLSVEKIYEVWDVFCPAATVLVVFSLPFPSPSLSSGDGGHRLCEMPCGMRRVQLGCRLRRVSGKSKQGSECRLRWHLRGRSLDLQIASRLVF